MVPNLESAVGRLASGRRIRNHHLLALAVCALLCWIGLKIASASNLIIESETLQSSSLVPGRAVPSIVVWDDFARALVAPALTSPINGGGWTAITGIWASDGAAARSGTSDDARLLASAASVDATIVANIVPGPHANAGLILNADATNALTVRYLSSGTMSLSYLGGKSQLLAVASVPVDSPPFELSATSSGDSITVRMNGVLILTYKLKPSQLCALKGIGCADIDPNTRFGLSAQHDPMTQFDSVRIETSP